MVSERSVQVAAFAARAVQDRHGPGLTPGAKCWRGYAAF